MGGHAEYCTVNPGALKTTTSRVELVYSKLRKLVAVILVRRWPAHLEGTTSLIRVIWLGDQFGAKAYLQDNSCAH